MQISIKGANQTSATFHYRFSSTDSRVDEKSNFKKQTFSHSASL